MEQERLESYKPRVGTRLLFFLSLSLSLPLSRKLSLKAGGGVSCFEPYYWSFCLPKNSPSSFSIRSSCRAAAAAAAIQIAKCIPHFTSPSPSPSNKMLMAALKVGLHLSSLNLFGMNTLPTPPVSPRIFSKLYISIPTSYMHDCLPLYPEYCAPNANPISPLGLFGGPQ